ncbi:MAG TPA: hypothetical protein VKV30_15465 [Candidatus Angelobacter sp.]|nr:hypothetical protein [Candidatus Angelobacter sp.]
MRTFLVVIFLSCAAFAQNDAAIATAKAACGPDKIHFDVEASDFSDSIAQPASGKALVYVISDQPGTTARFGLDGAWVGALNGNSHMSFSVDPGEHHVCANWQSVFSARSRYVALSSLIVEAGKVYYLRIRFTVQGEHGPPFMDLDVMNEDQGRYLVLNSEISRSHPKK